MGGGLGGAVRIIFFCCLPFFVENFVRTKKGYSDGKKGAFWLKGNFGCKCKLGWACPTL